ncbi:hypothetical protein AA313_de0204483 [Arthrobotrys entomopaga]|nr:hypothetical protein AA313_de0204483 [Arthrobotrys entomopaga]
MRKQLVVTVPAVWSERAKNLTLSAVRRAAFDADKISLVAEPEAAAIYTLKGIREGPNCDQIQLGDVFTVVEEATVGRGGKCGATFVDQEFLAWLEKWIGSEAYGRIPVGKKRYGSQLMLGFESSKFYFDGLEDEMEIRIPVEAGIDNDEGLNIEDRTMSLNAWSAVARGAVCRGLELGVGSFVSIRLARKFYGTAAAEPFIAGIYDPKDMFVDDVTGGRYASGQMTWLCKKGDRLPEDNPRTMSIQVSRDFEAHDGRQVGALLVGCTEDIAPRRFRDPAAKVICRVRGDFSDISLSQIPKSRSAKTGKEYYEIDFKLQATFASSEIHWQLIYKGKEYSLKSVTYED